MLSHKLCVLSLMLIILQSARCSNVKNAAMSAQDVAESLRILLAEIDSPLRLTALVCWETQFAIDFSRHLMRGYKGYAFAIRQLQVDGFPHVLRNEQHEMIVIDIGCEGDSLRRILMQPRFKWVFLSTVPGMELSPDILPANAIFTSANMYLIAKINTATYTFSRFYRYSAQSPLIVQLFGMFASNRFRSTDTGSQNRQNMHGTRLPSMTILSQPIAANELCTYRDKSVDTVAKVHLCMCLDLMDSLNATVELQQSADVGAGSQAYLADLVAGRLQFGALGIAVGPELLPQLDFVLAPIRTQRFFHFRTPSLSYTDNLFVLPFAPRVWYAFLLLIAAMGLQLMGLMHCEWRFAPANQLAKSPPRSEPSDAWLLVVGATCQQGSELTPRTPSARICVIVSFVALMFLYTSYSANIVALLQSPSARIQTLPDMLGSQLAMGMDGGDLGAQHYFAQQTEPVRKAIYEQKIKRPDGGANFLAAAAGMDRVRDSFYAFHAEQSMAADRISATFMEYEKCAIRKIRYMDELPPMLVMPKNSTWYEHFKIAAYRLIEHGVQSRHNRRLYSREIPCSGGESYFSAASIVDTLPAFQVLIWGFAVTGCVFAAECFVKYWRTLRANCLRLLRKVFGQQIVNV